MKSSTIKASLIIGFTVIALLFVGGIMLRRHRGLPQTQLEAKRYPHEHLHSAELEPRSKLNADHTLRKNETLAKVAALRYGHEKYSGVVKVFNQIEDASLIAADFKLRLPDVAVILAEEGLTKVIPKEVELILCSRAKYDKVVDQLWALRVQSENGYVLPDGVKRELLEAADDLQQATENLKSTRPGVIKAPGRMIGQLEKCMVGMRELASGEHDGYGYDIDMIQQRYALAITYGIIWARDGFK